ncbi:28S ribosomal protein S7, mitochondrial [Anthonomus grandis grandis]|uniref:28S ribosomal protein S7, mitochondrial n=1 Tax=Anthonomus grandis grandis TaxID=2921223 RepID=UPI002166B633|nr:28S ribosomal protein S7, mitochondrial [Anthonomus grandis grandis]
MATVKTLFRKCQLFKTNLQVLSSLTQQNGMAMYPSYYIEPVYKKEDQEALIKSGEFAKITHLPTKAALNNQTCSLYHDPLVALFTNYTMREGKKALARDLVEKAFESVKRIQLERYHRCTSEEDKAKIELNPKKIFHDAIKNCKPLLQLTGIKRGGAKYQVPVPISDSRSQFLAMNWLIEAAKEKDRKVRFSHQLAKELVDASNNVGRVVRRKQELHKQCEANKAYAHYRWS